MDTQVPLSGATAEAPIAVSDTTPTTIHTVPSAMTTAPGTLVKLLHAYQDRNAGEVFVTDATTAAALIDADLAVEETHVPSETFHGKDQLFIHAWNSTASDVNVTVYVGETEILTRSVPANEVAPLLGGERQFMPGDVIKAQAATTDAITITGTVNRVTP